MNAFLSKIIAPAFAAVDPAAGEIDLKPAAGSVASGLGNLTVGGMISGALNLVVIIVALVFFLTLVIGGINWITSGGDEKKVTAARTQLTNALIGLAIVFGAWAIMKLIGYMFGIDLLSSTLKFPKFTP